MFGIFRNHKRIHPNPHAFFRHHHTDFFLATCFFGTAFGNVQIAAKTNCYASIATRQIIDKTGRSKTLDVRTIFLQNFSSRLNIRRFATVWIFTHIVQHHRINFRRAVQIADAALLEFGRIFGVKHQLPLIIRQFIRAQSLFYTLDIDGESIGTPIKRHRIFMPRINTFHQFHQLRIQVFIVWNQGFVDFLIRTCLNLPTDKRIGRTHDVVTRLAGQYLAFQRFIAVIYIVSYCDTVFFLKRGNRLGIDIFRPVVNAQYLLIIGLRRLVGRSFVRAAAAGQCQRSQYDEGQMFGHYHSLRIRLKRERHYKAGKPGRIGFIAKRYRPA